MPTYAYACTQCEHRFEQQQAFSDPALSECPECTGRLRKLFNTVGIVFKGSGFYRTDSRNGSKAGSGSPAPQSPDGASPGTKELGSKEPGTKERGPKERGAATSTEESARPRAGRSSNGPAAGTSNSSAGAVSGSSAA